MCFNSDFHFSLLSSSAQLTYSYRIVLRFWVLQFQGVIIQQPAGYAVASTSNEVSKTNAGYLQTAYP